MTYILGLRCSNGVVVIADRKVTLIDGGSVEFDYKEKLCGMIRHIILGSSGSTDNLEPVEGEKVSTRIILMFLDPIGARLPLACTQSAKNQALLSLMNSVRFGEALCYSHLTCFAAGAFLFVIAIWRSSVLSTWIDIPLGIGFAVYIPQIFEPQSFRVAQRLLITIACILIPCGLLK